MPCYYTGSEEGDARLAVDEARKQTTRLNRILCHLCNNLSKNCIDPMGYLNKEGKKWWIDHQEIDKQKENY